jgi:hypothetical protein
MRTVGSMSLVMESPATLRARQARNDKGRYRVTARPFQAKWWRNVRTRESRLAKKPVYSWTVSLPWSGKFLLFGPMKTV